MSIIVDQIDNATGRYKADSAKVRTFDKKDPKQVRGISGYTETPEERDATASFLKDFRLAWQTMHLPRPEFNDLSLYQRHIVDMLAFNTYQENDGNPLQEDRLNGWKSQAMRPIVRNKAISIAAHETARLTIPKIFAYNSQDDEQTDAAKVMGYLVDWAREDSNYAHQALYRVIASLYSPISWGYSEYTQVYRQVKTQKDARGKWQYESILDEDESGFQHIPVSTDQVFFPNFFERDSQKQDYLILRRIISYDRAKAKYGDHKNFQYVQPGIQVIMDDANTGTFYNVYDPHMRGEDVEEVIRWRKSDDSRTVKVNGIWLSDYDAVNPRQDHQYPFDCFYYLPINERCIAGKSLVFATQSDANIANVLYQMIIDGTFLNLFPPTVTTGSDKVGLDVIVPGLNVAFSDQNVQVNALRTADGQSLNAARDTLEKVESSIAESSQDPVQQGQDPGTPSTAYEISRIEQNAATVLGLSMKFIAQHAIDYGKLVLSDVLQYLTIADASKITSDRGLLYKTFYAKEPGKTGKMNKVKFDINLPEQISDDDKMKMSFDILQEQGGIKADTALWKVNPMLFRSFKYLFTIDADVMNPRSADLVRAFDLETYDRAIANPVADQEKIFKDLLMATNPKTARDPDAYVMKKPEPLPAVPGTDPNNPEQGNTITPNVKPNTNGKPIPSSMGKLPQEMSA